MRPFLFFFFFNATATTEIYTLSLHDALPIYALRLPEGAAHDLRAPEVRRVRALQDRGRVGPDVGVLVARSEEHTSELQSRRDLVCRLLLEKKKKNRRTV